jgi:hypothetical protein
VYSIMGDTPKAPSEFQEIQGFSDFFDLAGHAWLQPGA